MPIFIRSACQFEKQFFQRAPHRIDADHLSASGPHVFDGFPLAGIAHCEASPRSFESCARKFIQWNFFRNNLRAPGGFEHLVQCPNSNDASAAENCNTITDEFNFRKKM